jgi:hypothetical protein
MLWDMEARKAPHPGKYIPSVVRAGSDGAWNRRRGDGGEYLDRCSIQRLWLSPQQYQLILERAFLNHDEQKVTFLGVPELAGPGGKALPDRRWVPALSGLFMYRRRSFRRPSRSWMSGPITRAADRWARRTQKQRPPSVMPPAARGPARPCIALVHAWSMRAG